MAATVDLVVVGCTSLIGETMLELLAEGRLPLGRLHAVDSGAAAGRRVEFKDGYLTVEALEGFDFGRARLALFATSERLTAEHAHRAAAAGCTVVDASGYFRHAHDVPLVVPEVNAAQLRGLAPGAIVASPSPPAVALALALKPLQDRVGIDRVDAVVCYPASAAGRSGIEELAAQTAQLLNAQAIEPRVFGRQLAFNLLPQVGELLDSGETSEEHSVAAQTSRLLAQAVAVSVTAVQVPVFYGLAAAVHIQTGAELSADAARALLAAAPSLKIVDGSSGVGYPTPVTEAARHDEVFVGRIRGDGSRRKGLNFWIVADNVRKGAAVNSIRLAELLVRGNR